MKFGVIVFPGSNCDMDCFYGVKDVLGCDVEYIRHDEEEIKGFDCIILPGGFSYGDYLRCGAIARFAKVMEAVKNHAARGKFVIGICNGFQILTEAGLLPGALVRNGNLKFICDTLRLKVESSDTPFTSLYETGEIIRLPIAHGEGIYVADKETLKEMRENGQILFTYTDNPNGSMENIAGICSKEKNVLGMMPHPERALEELLDNTDGRRLFDSVISALEENRKHENFL